MNHSYEKHHRSTQERMQGICLAVTTGPFAPQVLSIKADDKISNAVTAEVQVSNAGVLEQATAHISLVTLHSTITKQLLRVRGTRIGDLHFCSESV